MIIPTLLAGGLKGTTERVANMANVAKDSKITEYQ